MGTVGNSSGPRPPLLNESERPGSPHYMILAMAWAGWLFDFYDLMLFSFLLGPIKRDLRPVGHPAFPASRHEPRRHRGRRVAFGWLADRVGRKPVLSLTILTYSVGTFCCGLSTASGCCCSSAS